MISLFKILNELEINNPNITVKDVLKQLNISIKINNVQTTTILLEYGYSPTSFNIKQWVNSLKPFQLKQLYNDLQNISD